MPAPDFDSAAQTPCAERLGGENLKPHYLGTSITVPRSPLQAPSKKPLPQASLNAASARCPVQWLGATVSTPRSANTSKQWAGTPQPAPPPKKPSADSAWTSWPSSSTIKGVGSLCYRRGGARSVGAVSGARRTGRRHFLAPRNGEAIGGDNRRGGAGHRRGHRGEFLGLAPPFARARWRTGEGRS